MAIDRYLLVNIVIHQADYLGVAPSIFHIGRVEDAGTVSGSLGVLQRSYRESTDASIDLVVAYPHYARRHAVSPRCGR